MKKILLPHQFYFPYLDIIKERATQESLLEFETSLEKRAARKGMIYIHIPFCNSECSFCGFDKSYNMTELSRYIDVVKAEISHYSGKPYVQGLELTGIHIGGGSPTLLPKEILSELIDFIRSQFKAEHVPLNIECSALTVDDTMIDIFKEKQISRVSMGVQTFDPELRKQLNIKSSLDETFEALTKFKQAGIITFIDIMYGFPDLGTGDQKKTVESDVKKAVELRVEGIDFSQYYPFYNPLELKIRKEGLRFPSSEDLVDIILNATSIMESTGYVQTTEYIFCKKGEIILEKAYFGDSDCVAVGPSSLGLLNGFKYRNKRHASYLKSEVPGIMSIRRLGEDELERIPIVGFPRLLRLSKDMLTEKLKDRYMSKLGYLINIGMLEETHNSFVLTGKGKAYINNIYFIMLEEAEQKEIERRLNVLKSY